MSNMRPQDRRRHPRVPARALSFLSAQLSGGAAVTLLDVSHGGVRLETPRHMRPGQTVCIRFSLDEDTVAVNARVVRATVTRVEAERVSYETALHLADDATSEQFQVALVARRREARDRAPDTAPPDVATGLDFILVGEEQRDEAAAAPPARHGWWLTDARRRRRVVS